MKFIHAADVHLDSPLRGLERYEGAPVDEIRSATRRAFDNLVDLAIEEDVGCVLLAGDLYDGDWKDYNTGLYFIGRMQQLESAGIHVFIVAGRLMHEHWLSLSEGVTGWLLWLAGSTAECPGQRQSTVAESHSLVACGQPAN